MFIGNIILKKNKNSPFISIHFYYYVKNLQTYHNGILIYLPYFYAKYV